MIEIQRFSAAGLLAGLACFLFSMVFAGSAEATPAFARRYQTSCVTCHSTFPVLNAVGDAFRLDGYRFKDDEQYLKQKALELGDEAYKKLWPDAMWPGHIPATSGLSASARMFAEIDVGDTNPTREADVTFVLPHEAEINWCGNLGEGIAAYGDIIFEQEDAGTREMDSWAMAKAWIELSDLAGPEDMVNLRVGTVGVHTIGLYTAKDEQGMGLQYYQFNTWQLPGVKTEGGTSVISFSGNTFFNQPQLGLELCGFGRSWLYYGGVVNGNMEEDPGDLYFVGVGKNTDTKDYYAGMAWKFGGLGFNGASGSGENDPLASRAEFWRDDNITLTAFGYTGTAQIIVDRYDDNTFTSHTETISKDDFWRLSIGARGQYRDLILNAGYQWAHDDNPFGVLLPDDVDATAWFVETAYFVYPWLIPYARYEEVNMDIPYADPAGDIRIEDKQGAEVLNVGVKAHLRANVSVAVEYQDFFGPEFNTTTDELLFIQLMFAY
ncbi:MAG: hypothetical protein ACOZBW_10735 [Thermodesulfobacteriota bacterium]